jgi:formylglycine-generating enzyme required for sulfatase activity
MDEGFTRIVKDLLHGHGPGVLDETRLSGLLKDKCGGKFRGEIRLFLMAVERNFHGRLAGAETSDLPLLAGNLAALLRDDYFVGEIQTAPDEIPLPFGFVPFKFHANSRIYDYLGCPVFFGLGSGRSHLTFLQVESGKVMNELDSRLRGNDGIWTGIRAPPSCPGCLLPRRRGQASRTAVRSRQGHFPDPHLSNAIWDWDLFALRSRRFCRGFPASVFPGMMHAPSNRTINLEKRMNTGHFLLPLLFAFQGMALAADYTDGIGVEFVRIPAGSFLMGSPASDPYCGEAQKPRHRVTLTRPFYLGQYEVTQKQWLAVMDENPSEFEGPDNPVERVSWDDAREFIRRLNRKEGTEKYRLPTEAEWEYAARAGAMLPEKPCGELSWELPQGLSGPMSTDGFGRNAGDLREHAWYSDNSGDRTHPVGQLKPNAWGLYDMLGNVDEWVQDWFALDWYAQSPEIDPQGPAEGTCHVQRGGSWVTPEGITRKEYRTCIKQPDRKFVDRGRGIRLVRELD